MIRPTHQAGLFKGSLQSEGFIRLHAGENHVEEDGQHEEDQHLDPHWDQPRRLGRVWSFFFGGRFHVGLLVSGRAFIRVGSTQEEENTNN